MANTVYKLKHPITIDGQTVHEIAFRRLKGKDLRDMENQPKGLQQTFWLIQQLAVEPLMPPEGPEELDGQDLDAIAKLIEGFLGRQRRA